MVYGELVDQAAFEYSRDCVHVSPIASLCRFRAVSKKWKRLISDPDFASRHARASPPEEYVLITMRYGFKYDSRGMKWETVLDVANGRYCRLSCDFLTKYIKQEAIVPVFPSYYSWMQMAILAADEGLFCVLYAFNKATSALFVCNPVLKTVQQLPHLAKWAEDEQPVVMSTDRLSINGVRS